VKKIIANIIITVLILSLTYVVHAEGKLTVSVASQTISKGEGTALVNVPVTISNNTGVLGLVLKISYNPAITLTAVEKGAALSTLNYTPPGKYTDNPVKVTWDGIDAEDSSNGEILILTFSVPVTTVCQYDVSVSYDAGNFFDGNMDDIDAVMLNGNINVEESEGGGDLFTSTTTKSELGNFYLFTVSLEKEVDDKKIIIAGYNDAGEMLCAENVDLSTMQVIFAKDTNIDYFKVFVWDSDNCPLTRTEVLNN